MCGIAGIIDPRTPPDQSLLDRLAAPLARRGPDDSGFFLTDRIGLAHRRLSIIDLDGGRQPLFNEDQSLALVFNGEIYDFRRQRRELLDKGHRFATRTDSEVLLHLYEEEGIDMLDKLNGMFAFAICNVKTGELVLARDRLGQKPLFYVHDGDRFAFASGPASLRPIDWVDISINPQALHDYLEFLYVPEPQCIYNGIRKLSPGAWLRFDDGKVEHGRYWQPQLTGNSPETYAESCEQLQERLSAAVKRRLVADVPLGMFLSGGMDSSIICALAQKQLGSQTARTFAIGFPNPKYDERHHAQTVADHLGTEHHCLEVEPGSFADLRWIVGQFEEPFADSSMLPTALLAKFTREHVTVALSGDAADEFFGGYYRYRVYKLCELLTVCPQAMRAVVKRMLLKLMPPMTEERSFAGKLRRLVDLGDVDGLQRYLQIISRFPEDARRRIHGERLRAAAPQASIRVLQEKLAGDPTINAIMELDLRSYLVDDILVKVDRAAMAHSLEVRSPFLDPDVVDLAMALPYRFKQHGANRKRILKDTFKDLLPNEIFARPKMGFGVPVAAWLRGDWQQPATELLLDGHLVRDAWFDRDAVEDLLDAHGNEQADNSYPLFALLVFELWLQHTRE